MKFVPILNDSQSWWRINKFKKEKKTKRKKKEKRKIEGCRDYEDSGTEQFYRYYMGLFI